MRLFAFVLLFAIRAAAGIVAAGPRPDPIPDVAAWLDEEDNVAVFEGMPHPMWEPRVLRQEIDQKPHFIIEREGFYEASLPVTADDKAALTVIFQAPRLFQSHHEHFCGGFHADYAVEWKRTGVRVAVALICFGCGEAKVIRQELVSHVDLTKESYAALQAILSKYRQNRPKMDPAANKPPSKTKPRMDVNLPIGPPLKP
ncbi:MAG: hypothetical protein JWQ83_2053 [Lacunisphaera sp.]|nr:hypothetical protein [Lacunisphaera sp.]MDB6166913.1 hypothetical protein [Lacunisphaera sp.]